ncbi:MAG: integral rane sensor signal transduction histidine kinase, partial [Daejeonella sp.]|nr:integral rane sensor signal transduction histidine kinase [Daejeonella sp.]
MKRSSIILIVSLMAVALLGVVAMQYYFIRESFRLKSQMFDQSVNEALKNVIYKIEKRDAILFMKRKAADRSREEKFQQKRNQEARQTNVIIKKPEARFTELVKIRQRKIDQDFKIRDSLLRARYPKAFLVDKDFYETYLKNP